MVVRTATTTVDVGELAQEFSLSEEDLIRQGLRAFVLEQLRLLQAEKHLRCAKFGVDFIGRDG